MNSPTQPDVPFPGSRWWKFDFHTHTPKSNDYGRGGAAIKGRTPEDWLLDFMRSGFDAVAVTDHNSGEWVDALKTAHEGLRAHAEFREMALFPGAEIAASGGVHVLLLLDPAKTTSDVAGLVRSCGYTGSWGDDGARCDKSLKDIVKIASGLGALVIPAHVDDDAQTALWHEDHNTFCGLIEHRDIFAWERKSLTSQRPPASAGCKKRFAEVLGSDAHKPTSIGEKFTWVKMSRPNLEGLRLALLDGELCLQRSDEMARDPNEDRAAFVIERFEVEKAQFMGRVAPFVVEFNPWMNAIIGERGTGKSSLVEFMRIALRREGELKHFDELNSEFQRKYAAEWKGKSEGGLQTPKTQLRLIYRKDGIRYLVRFARDASPPTIEEEDGAGGWKVAQGEVTSRFPVRIYSQKQVFELAGTPSALLRIIDQDQAVGRVEWETEWARESETLHGLCTRIREMRATLDQENRLRGELADVSRKLDVLQAAGNQEALRMYQRMRSQTRQMDQWARELADMPQKIGAVANEIGLSDLDREQFDAAADADVLAEAAKLSEGVDKLGQHLKALVIDANNLVAQWSQFSENSPWRERVKASQSAYDGLVQQLHTQGIQDPKEFGERIRQKQEIEQQLKALESRKADLQNLEIQRTETVERVARLRRDLTQKRVNFLATVLQKNPFVRVTVAPFGDHESALTEYRRIIRREDGMEDRILAFVPNSPSSGILAPCYPAEFTPAQDFEIHLREAKRRTREIAKGNADAGAGIHGTFRNHLSKLRSEDLDDLDLWFPEDTLHLEYRPREGESFRPISQGSPGQKTAALLAFLLSYGTEPILLDQPEDDLDNQLIYSLVTQQLISNKSRRQVIVVTHNANIVVNGDAELVVALESNGGQTKIKAQGGLQEDDVRRNICDIMEGGEVAFEKRYRRIKEDLKHV
ncbi:MAG: AAA family ATPase [Terrimicrobiaceae bacterium]|nr:AAA family ATPase [Terrimicrobiaceae bacterium]